MSSLVTRRKNQIWADSEGRWARIIYLRTDNVVIYDFRTKAKRQMDRAAFERKFHRFVRGGETPPGSVQPQASA